MLRTIRLTGAVFLESEMPVQWCYLTPSAQTIREQLIPGESVVAFHLVVEGSCVAWLPGSEPIELEAGELVLFPQGDRHILASSLSTVDSLRPTEVRCESLRSISRRGGKSETPSEGSLCRTKMICGYIACGGYSSMPLLEEMPRIFHVKGNEQLSAWLRASMKFCLLECDSDQAGSSLTVEKVAELMLIQAIRQHMTVCTLTTDQPRFVTVKDRFVRKALTLIHGNPSRPWTVTDLSRSVGLSRSALAGRFVLNLGEPPMQYVSRWRISLAADALLSTRDGVVQIAANVGYESEAAFNRAFKREYGLPPATWRKQACSRSPLPH
jgi:AraC-like DNA-binding protein